MRKIPKRMKKTRKMTSGAGKKKRRKKDRFGGFILEEAEVDDEADEEEYEDREAEEYEPFGNEAEEVGKTAAEIEGERRRGPSFWE